MKADTREWIRCAEEDYTVARTLMRQRKKVSANSIGFHCQQCVEKYLKARLEETGLPTPKIHNLVKLLDPLLAHEPLWAAFNPSLFLLNQYAVKFRYPGHTATKKDAKGALAACQSIRAEVRLSLGLSKK